MALHDREFVNHQGRRLILRDHNRRPGAPNCPMHLRRACGTCAHFPAGAAMRAPDQLCGRLKVTVNGTRCAANCKFWTRKRAGTEPVKPKKKEKDLG